MSECGRCQGRRADPSLLCGLMLTDRHCPAALDTKKANPSPDKGAGKLTFTTVVKDPTAIVDRYTPDIDDMDEFYIKRLERAVLLAENRLEHAREQLRKARAKQRKTSLQGEPDDQQPKDA